MAHSYLIFSDFESQSQGRSDVEGVYVGKEPN